MPPWHLDPVFVSGPAGRLFALHIRPRNGATAADEAVLYLPPFAEEMNRTRRMASLLGRRLAEQGIGFFALDPYGTGDSDGEFQEARWATWRADAQAAVAWLKDRSYQKISVLGLRLGACLALSAAESAGPALNQIVLWQPVLKGETFINQFLRIRVAAGMSGDSGGEKETIKGLRAQFAAGGSLEVAGYALNPGLIQELDGLALADLVQNIAQAPLAHPIAWFEVNRNPEAKLTPASRATIEGLRDQNVSIEASTITGEPFWSIEEPAYVPDLWTATAALWHQPKP